MDRSGGYFDGPDREAFKAALFHGAILELRQSTSWHPEESLFVRLTGARQEGGSWLSIEVESIDGQRFTGSVRFGSSGGRVELRLTAKTKTA